MLHEEEEEEMDDDTWRQESLESDCDTEDEVERYVCVCLCLYRDLSGFSNRFTCNKLNIISIHYSAVCTH